MTNLTSIVDEYLAIWNETDAEDRRKKIGQLWAADGTYTDPLAAVSGRDSFSELIGAAQQQFSGLQLVRGATYDEHHNIVRFTWNLVPGAGAEPVAIGFDVAEVNEVGQISNVYGFIDKMPAGA
ncbi:MAG TPA: nuclear transport factor 2 family protein [Streptosporangiaceae bacterium]|nr:nuclear transport factor 2 family protein [Streptosporangiaceae bacterium]